MALIKKTQRSFSGGMLDKDLMGRQDLQKYSQGCLSLENFKVRKQGNIVKRAGTDLMCDFTGCLGESAVSTAKIIPLIQERESGYYILITGQRAFLVSPNGMRMSDGTWSRKPSVTEDVTPYSIEVPFADNDLKMLDWCQSGDTIFFAHRSYAPGRIVYDSGSLTYIKNEFRQASGTTQPIIKSVKATGSWTSSGGDKEIEYCVTAVKDGVESAPSVAYAVSYKLPWPDSCGFVITIDSSSIDTDDFDTFYIYKKEGDVFGLIGTTSNQTSFVSISKSLSIGGSLYPSGFKTFDKTVHLRESGNKFATVSEITPITTTNLTATIVTLSPPINLKKYKQVTQSELDKIKKEFKSQTGTNVCTEDKVCSSSAQRSASSSITYTLDTAGVCMSTCKVRIGSIDHIINRETTVTTTEALKTYTFKSGGYSFYYYLPDPEVLSSSSSTKWVGKSTTFSACPAKFFTAVVEYYNGSSWVTSDAFDCEAAVDQSNPGSEWKKKSGATNIWTRTYSDDTYMLSYSSAADVISRMDANAPAVGAVVNFTLPEAAKGKKVRKITIYGYADTTKEASAGLIVNGISCYDSGAYVYTFTDNYITPDLTITPPKTDDHFVNPGEYPGSVQIYQQRLVYASSVENPFTFWMSCVGDLYNFDAHEYVRSSDAITASTAAVEMPRINRMLVHRDLMLFAEGGEWQVAPSSGNTIAPSTISAKLQSAIGCASWLKPLPIDADIIFCDSAGENLFATRYNFASDGYESSNLSVLSQRLFRNNPIQAMAYAQFPESTIECVLADGNIASLVYMKEHDVCSWSLQRLGGDWKAVDVAANKTMIDGTSHCAFVAARTFTPDGETATKTEWGLLGLRDMDPNDATLEGNLRMDAIRTVVTNGDMEPALSHGESAVKIGSDKWAIGCIFESVLKTTSPEFTDQETAQMEIKNATESEVRVIDGSSFTVRQPDVDADKATLMRVASPISTDSDEYMVTLGDADCKLPLTGANSWNGSIIVTHDGYLPLAILSVTTAYRIEYANHANGGSAAE